MFRLKQSAVKPAFIVMFFLIIAGAAYSVSGSISSRGPVNNSYSGKPAKYVFLFIGDGMGLPQVSSAEVFAGAMKGGKYPDAPRSLSFTSFGAQGITTTHDASSFITDSASSGTAIATGNKTLNGIISMDVAKKSKYKSIATIAKEKGMKVGIISSVSIDHATPAVFYSNVPSRKMMYEVGLQLADSGFDYFAGGSVVDPDGKKSKMENKPGNLFDYAKNKGYKIVKSKSEFSRLKSSNGKVWAITEQVADDSAMLYEIDRSSSVLSLKDFTKKGIELLDNEKGFFMMVEGGKIDWACHANDGMSAIKDVYAFDEAVREAVAFAKKHPDETLIVVTGDHECGGMTVGFAGTKYDTFFQKLKKQNMSYIKFDEKLAEMNKKNGELKFDEVVNLVSKHFGLSTDKNDKDMGLTDYEMQLLKDAFAQVNKKEKSDSLYLLYGDYNPLSVTVTHILNRKAGIGWTTYSHTGIPVPTYAKGAGEEIFDGYYDNTDIFKKLTAVMKLQ